MLGIEKIKAKFQNSKSSKDILYLIVTQILLKPIQFVKSFVVAKYLGPEEYGILKSVELIQMLNKFGNLGFKNALVREATTSRAKGELEHVQTLKNNAYTGEFVLSFLIFIAGVVSSVFFEDKIISIAIILASISLFSMKLLGIIRTELQLEEDFKFMSKTILYVGFLNSVFIMATVPFFSIYSVLTVPILSTLFVVYVAYRKTGKFFSFKVNKVDFKNLLKISIPLTFGSLAFGLFRYTERILIISFLGLTAVGYFGFADTIASILIAIMLSSVIKVRKMKIYDQLGKENFQMVHRMVKKETIALILISIALILVIAVGLKIFIPMFLPKWVDATNITILFLFVVPLKLMSSYVSIVVKAPVVNKLIFEPIMQVVITGVIIIGIYALHHFNQLTLLNFLIIDVIAYAILHISYVFYYYKHYVLQFLR